MDRVKSENLFNFPQRGCYDEDVKAYLLKQAQVTKEKYGIEGLAEGAADEASMLPGLRGYMKVLFQEMASSEHYIGMLDQCTTDSFHVPNTTSTKVYVHTPKSLDSSPGKRTAILYAHGGGAISGTADMYQPLTAALAVETGCVVFSVEYRLAPEAKCPDNIMDFYDALKYVSSNCEKWSLDPEQIIISGESGGGYITFGAMVVLAQRDESHLVKLAVPIIPMISDYTFTDPASMTVEERAIEKQGQKQIWKYIARDLDAQWSDPLLFPAKASDELLQKMPPTMIVSAEFDLYITESERMSRRLRAAGRLVEWCCIPGITHAAYTQPDLACYHTFYNSYRLAIQTYVRH